MVSEWKRIFVIGVVQVLAWAMLGLFAPFALAQLGTDVTNIATISQDTPAGPIEFQTNAAVFTIEARRTPSEIEFFRIAENAPDGIMVQLNGADFSPTGNAAEGFTAITPPSAASSGPVRLLPAQTYLSGETMIVRVIDRGQNGDPNQIETVYISVEASNGDTIVLRLYESGPDTGAFYAYFASSPDPTPANDETLTAPPQTRLDATYIDVFDATEVSVDTAFVDSFGRVFDSYTGELLNGVSVTVIDDETGLPAAILGVEGSGSYPATVTTGSDVTDSRGMTYAGAEGVFLFPILPAGRYRLRVDAPERYIFPSIRTQDDFIELPNGPFETQGSGSFGLVFEQAVSGPLVFDVPLDPNGDLIVRKMATVPSASLGDVIGYTVELENAGSVPAPFLLQDTLPRGLRYVSGSARLEGSPFADPTIDATGRSLLFNGEFVPAGDRVRLSYLVSVGPGTPLGEVVNSAVAVNQTGQALSNRADAAVVIEEDLLSERLTIVGRVAEAACAPDQPWARNLLDGQGVAGVRLYMETGRYVVTDENGLYHFEGIEPGTHIVQVDEATLPTGYQPVVCEENSRYAGSALSKFVDASGGTIWRANFYLERTEAADLSLDAASVQDAKTEDESAFNQAWLDRQIDPTPRWVYPEPDETPEARSLKLGLIHPPNLQVELSLNGRAVSGLNYSGRDLSVDRTVALSRWSGVDIQPGQNLFEAVFREDDGTEITRITREVWFVDEVDRAWLVADQSITQADGRTKPVIAIRVEDADGHPVHSGRLLDVQVAEPYRLAQTAEDEFAAPVTAELSAVTGIPVGAGGIVRVELEPTLESGRVRVQVALQNDRVQNIDLWLQPEKRDWVLVGLAEAEGLLSNIDGSGGRHLDEVMTDGRVAFFAKGVVRGDWLLTVAMDTAKRRGRRDGEVFDDIDPNAYYTLYGDRTWQFNNAESRYPVYVKLEKDTFQAVFGDYETGLTDTELGRYSRRLSGLKADYESEQLSVTAFAAETNQVFNKDELAADGTSGPFQIKQAPLVRTSEVITIETRDRFRNDEILKTTLLSRYIDYEIDYVTGEIFFRQPIPATDTGLNPNVIVVDYETAAVSERGVTAGVRAAARLMNDRVETGVTLLHEDDGRTRDLEASTLVAADMTIRLNETSEIRAEVARSQTDTELGTKSGDALLLEATRQTERLSATAYYREETDGFGLGQQSSSTSALRRVGAQLSAELGVARSDESPDRAIRSIEAQAYREENLSQSARRELVDITVQQASQSFGAGIGLRAVNEAFEASGDAARQSVLLTGQVRKTFLESGLTVSAAHEEPIWRGGNNDDEVTLFPERTTLGLDKTLGRRATLNLRHEITNGTNASGDNTIAGVTWEPRGGTQLRAATDVITNESGRRIGATVGVDQNWQITKAWTASAGLTRRSNVDGGDLPLDAFADDAVSPLADGVRNPLAVSESYTSAYLGAGYRGDDTAASARLEVRDSATGERLVAALGGAREVSKTLSFSAIARHQAEHLREGSQSQQTDIRLGAAWRSRSEDLTILNRLDLGHAAEDDDDRAKLVNNLAVNAMVSNRTQVSVYHGLKHVETSLSGAKASGLTHLIGGEARYDITPKIDLGLHATWTSGELAKTDAWSFGPSLGYTPRKNVWVSVGWNLEGFEDEDFEAARYTRQGPFIKLRAKFDQHTVKGLMQDLGLSRQ